MAERTCGAQTYYYDGEGEQQAFYCDRDAVAETEAMDGSCNFGCAEHADMMINAGAKMVRRLRSK